MNHRARTSRVLLAAAILLLWGGRASAQDAYLARWQLLHARQPEAVSFAISATKGEFYSGELVPLQLSFASNEPKGFLTDTRLQDRVGRLNGMEEFLIDPAALAEDPWRGLPGENMGMGGLSGGPVLLSGKPFSFERLLNEWVRFRQPGRYRIAILSRRITQVTDSTRSEYYLQTHQGGDRLELVSNILTLNIAPAPAAWVKEQIAEAVKVLDGPLDPSEGGRQRSLRAASTLRFLESPEAAAELARHLGSGEDVDSWSLHIGVLGSPYRKQLLPLMEARLIAPDQPVWDRYLDTLSRLYELVASGGPMHSFPKDEALQGAWRDELRRRDDLRQRKRNEYTARLVASLPAKQAEARLASMNTLLDWAARSDGGTPWLPALTASLIADFRHLPPKTQSNLLAGRWNVIRSPAMLPILREICAHPPEQPVNADLQDIAVRRLYELAPDEGRSIILSQIAQPATRLSLTTLTMLPDRSLPEMNEVLAARLEAGHWMDMLILRYATGDIVQRVEKADARRDEEFDRQKLPHCGGPLTYYFLKYDPAYGERELRSQMAQPNGAPVCYDIGFQFLALDRNAYSPALERLAIEFLPSPKVPVKRGAAEVLGKYGSPAAQKPLWETLEYFRSWWKGREPQLEDMESREGLQFERALRIALAQADGWTLQEEGLNRLLGLCSTNWCRQEVKGWLAQATSPVGIGIMPGADGFRATIAQYETSSHEQLRRKILQFPAGTVFRLVPLAGGDNRARADAEQIVRSAGYSLVPQ
jgi:hypothetical protein